GIDEQLAGLGREQRSIAALCREVVSVAEIAGRLDLLLGVTRVIVGDMALQGVVVLYRPQATVADADLPPVELLKRVLHASRTSRSDLRRAVVLLVGCALLAAGCTVGGRHGGGTHAGGSPRIEETRRRAM
ncbi:MAG TPA: DUF742 domain-containing protein, partial [Jiangellaceae bacterium]|nr:DUF742 domain-containing protein [Jiangellaceae bacterium]